MRAMASDDHVTFHLLPLQAWIDARAMGRVAPDSLATEGFVHCTDGWAALVDTANRHYRGIAGPFLGLGVDLERVGAPWRYDDAARVYPHVYGPLPLSAIVSVRPMARAADGRFLTRAEVDVNSMEPLLDRLSSAGARLASTRPTVEAGAPWPTGAAGEGGGEHEWGPTEVLSHVAEMLPYWLGEMERVIAGTDGHGGGGPAPFGRTATDQVRALTIARDATLPVRELYDRIAAALQRYRWRLPELTEDEISRTGVHPTRGELTVPDLVERFAVRHLEEHAEQLETTLPA
jgi:uncharacterized protein (DUF952 family)